MIPRSAIHVCRINWVSRRILWDLVLRDFRLRYLGSALGTVWNFLHPLAMIVIFSVVFSRLNRADLGPAGRGHPLAYTMYLCSALLPWNAFVDGLLRGTRGFHENAGYIKKMSFPLEIVHPVAVGAASVTLVISWAIYITLMAVSGFGVGSSVLLLPLIYILQVLLVCGMAMVLSILNVFFRDVEQVTAIALQLGFWLTPIVYLEAVIPAHLHGFLYLNPFYFFTRLYHQVLFLQEWPSAKSLAGTAALCLAVFVLGAAFLSRLKDQVPDEV